MNAARTSPTPVDRAARGDEPARRSSLTILFICVIVAGLVAGGLLWLVTDYVDKYGPEGNGWSFRGNGSLVVLYGGFLLLLLVSWAGLAVWQHRSGLPTAAVIAGIFLPISIIAGYSATSAAVSTWFSAQSMARAGHTATLLAGGRVLVMGGIGAYGSLKTAAMYDPASAAWSQTAPMPGPSTGYTATLLPSHRVLVAGGGSPAESSVYVYDPQTGTWSSAGRMHRARYGHAAVLLPSGKVLVAGGGGIGPENLKAAAEVYDPATAQWSLTGPMRRPGVNFHSAVLGDRKVLTICTSISPTTGGLLVGAQVYDPAIDRWSLAPDVPGMTEGAALLPLPDGRALALGLNRHAGAQATAAAIYDPAKGAWSPPQSVTSGRYDFSVTLLQDGRALVAGGNVVLSGTQRAVSVATAQPFDPRTGRWSTTGSMHDARSGHTLTLLPSGKVLAVGGNASGYLDPGALTAELYDPETGAWSETVQIGSR